MSLKSVCRAWIYLACLSRLLVNVVAAQDLNQSWPEIQASLMNTPWASQRWSHNCTELCSELGGLRNAKCVQEGGANIGRNPDEPLHPPGLCIQLQRIVENGCPKICVQDSGSARPHFMLMGILYAPPGNSSVATVTQAIQAGTTVGDSSTFLNTHSVGISVSVGEGGNGGSVGLTHSESSGDGQSVSVALSTTETDMKTVRSSTDLIDHDQDVLLLWVSPQVNLAGGPTAGVVTTDLAIASGEAMRVVPIKVAYLKPGGLIPEEYLNPAKKCPPGEGPDSCIYLPGLGQLSNQEKSQLIAMDHMIGSDAFTKPDPTRFGYIESQHLAGSDVNSGYGETFGETSAISTTKGWTQTTGQADQLSVSVSVGSPFAHVTYTNSDTWSWTYTRSEGVTAGTSTTASVTLNSSTPRCCDAVQGNACYVAVYEDRVFHTFAFIPEITCKQPVSPIAVGLAVANKLPEEASHQKAGRGIKGVAPIQMALSGAITSKGKPLIGRAVTISKAGALLYKTYTDMQGQFKVPDLPVGRVDVMVDDKTYHSTVAANHTAQLKIDLPNPTVPADLKVTND